VELGDRGREALSFGVDAGERLAVRRELSPPCERDGTSAYPAAGTTATG
jgi:hypothetical protein